MDGVTGIYSPDDRDIGEKIFKITGMIQHRGKAAAGLAVGNHKGIDVFRGLGRIGEVIQEEDIINISHLGPQAAIGNVGYTKNTTAEQRNVEPIRIAPKNPSRYQVVITMDGHIVNLPDAPQSPALVDICKELSSDYRFLTSNQTEVVGALLHQAIERCGINTRAGTELVRKLSGRGSYAITALVYDGKETHLVTLNDERAFEPFCYGVIDQALVISSESVSHRKLKGRIDAEFRGAEMSITNSDGTTIEQLANVELLPDIFQPIYFGNVASLYQGRGILGLRELNGQALADFYVQRHGIPNGEVVIPNPESGRGVTVGIYNALRRHLRELGADFSEYDTGIIRITNPELWERYERMGNLDALVKLAQAIRTFQEGAVKQRATEVGLKFAGIDELLVGQAVHMGDDSIVKGSVSEGGSTWWVYNCGATELTFWVSYGPMVFPSFKEWHRGEECLRELAVQRAFSEGNPHEQGLDDINLAVAKLINVDYVRYNTRQNIESVMGRGSFQALDPHTSPIAEYYWPDWFRKEVERYDRAQ